MGSNGWSDVHRAPPGAAQGRLWIAIVITSVVATGIAVYAVTAARTGRADDAVAHASQVLALERRLGLDIERGVRGSFVGTGMLGEAFSVIYALLYWPFVVGTLVVTAWLDRARFRLARNAMMISGAVGLAVMATFPVAPPRLLDGA